MVTVNELVERGGTGPRKTSVVIEHGARNLSLHPHQAPMQEMWWFSNTGSLYLLTSGGADIGGRGLTIKPGDPAVVTEHNQAGQQGVFGRVPLAARLTTWSKDNVSIGRLQAFSEEASIDWKISITPTNTDPQVSLSTYAGETTDFTVVHTEFDVPVTATPQRNAVLGDDGSRAFAEEPTLSTTARVHIDLDPAFALIDVLYSHYDGSGGAGLMARLNGGTMRWLTYTNTVTPSRVDKNGWNTIGAAGGSIRLLSDTHWAYGRVTCAQMHDGTWQCWVRAHQDDHRFCEAMFIITPTSPTALSELVLDSGHAHTGSFVHTAKKYQK